MQTATFTGDLIPDSVEGYAHYWLKMVVTETNSTSTDISGTVALYFCRNNESGAGYQFDTGKSLSVKLGSTSIFSSQNVCKLHVNGGAASETLMTTVNWSDKKASDGSYKNTFSATFAQTQNTRWSGTATGTFVGTTVSPTNTFIYDGTNWKKGVVWVYDGANWKKAQTKTAIYDGTNWRK